MLFNSLQFLIFFLIVIPIYFILPHKYRWGWLLGASCYFYMVFIPQYILILFFLIAVDYVAGIAIDGANSNKKKRIFLIISLITNFCTLGFFKYFNFFNANASAIANAIGWNYPLIILQIALPIGLSFHTFQSVSYTIEVYRGNQKAERNFWVYALYVMFFPQLVAGPIERPQNLLHQFYEKHSVDCKRILHGLKLMLWGFFKKVVVADRIATFVNVVYGSPHEYSGPVLLLATVLYAFQIYGDFSGYSDIAIGAAEVMGFKLMTNFRRPYFAKTISEFWKRWHISLSSWFRDYLYIPLGGSRVPVIIWYFNLFFVFLVSGLWHGASWAFVIWGGLHGFYLIFSIFTEELRLKIATIFEFTKHVFLHNVVKIISVFILADFAWIFFRAADVGEAWYIITHLFFSWNISALHQFPSYLQGWTDVALLFAPIIMLICIEIVEEYMLDNKWFAEPSPWFEYVKYILLTLIILLFGVFQSTKFIYFQF